MNMIDQIYVAGFLGMAVWVGLRLVGLRPASPKEQEELHRHLAQIEADFGVAGRRLLFWIGVFLVCAFWPLTIWWTIAKIFKRDTA